MENKLQVFENEEFGQLRTLNLDGVPYAVGKDVASILGYEIPRKAIIDHVDEEDKILLNEKTLSQMAAESKGSKTEPFKFDSPRGLTFINESGIYSLIFSSRLPKAKKFKRWVTSEVLPAIRKTGFYSAAGATPEELFTNPSNIRLLLDNWERDREKLLQAEKTIELQKPKVLFADAVETSKTSILVGALAKLITQNGVNIGQNSLFEWLRNNGYLIKAKNGNWNMPTQSAMTMGLFEVKESTHNNPDGSVRICKTTKVTGKGQTYFVNKFLGKNAND